MKISNAVFFCLSIGVAGIVHGHGDKHVERKSLDRATAEQTEFGIAGDPKKADRVIRIAMEDKMRFTPDAITVRQGETVKFIVTNKGRILHEMVIGTPQELQQHAAMMRKFLDMEHDEPHMVHVDPGKSESLVWTFNKAGEFEFACLIPGHFEAGMVGKIKVSGSSQASNPAERAGANTVLTDGEVKKVDRQAGKIVIKHGPVANLDMPAMTMAFRVKDAAMLDQVKPGDKIRFEVGRIKGAYTLMRIDPAR
jgi:uncharacterized cupredoxin-like copper-binding protein